MITRFLNVGFAMVLVQCKIMDAIYLLLSLRSSVLNFHNSQTILERLCITTLEIHTELASHAKCCVC